MKIGSNWEVIAIKTYISNLKHCRNINILEKYTAHKCSTTLPYFE